MSDSAPPLKMMRPNTCTHCQRQFASSLTPSRDIRSCKTCHKQIIYDPEKDGGGDSGIPIKAYQLNLFHRKDWLGPRQEVKDEVLEALEPTEEELELKAEEEQEEDQKKKKADLDKRKEAAQKLSSLLKVVSVGEAPLVGKPWLQAWHSPFGLENHLILENAMRGDSLQWTYVVTADVAAYRFMRIATLDRIPFQLGALQGLTPVTITHSPHKPPAIAPKPENTTAALFSHFSPSEQAQIRTEAEAITTQIRQVLKR